MSKLQAAWFKVDWACCHAGYLLALPEVWRTGSAHKWVWRVCNPHTGKGLERGYSTTCEAAKTAAKRAATKLRQKLDQQGEEAQA